MNGFNSEIYEMHSIAEVYVLRGKERIMFLMDAYIGWLGQSFQTHFAEYGKNSES